MTAQDHAHAAEQFLRLALDADAAPAVRFVGSHYIITWWSGRGWLETSVRWDVLQARVRELLAAGFVYLPQKQVYFSDVARLQRPLGELAELPRSWR